MTSYKVAYTSAFKRQRKLLIARGHDISLLDDTIRKLANGEALPERYCDHALQGSRKGYRDCHIRPDWVLIYKIEDEVMTLLLSETGSHADLF
jgi:mRNA interferase YafQ